MREIKFRAWLADDYPVKSKRESYLFEDQLCVDGALDGAKKGNVILEQYTGMKDIEGKEIYEGDIVEYTAKCSRRDEIFKNTIEYYEQSNKAGFFIIAKDRRMRYILCKNQIYNHKIKVVGNIHEAEYVRQ